MVRDGNAWKRRQRERRLYSNEPRKTAPRKLIGEPQFKFEDLYISPFSKQQTKDEMGRVSYIPVEHNLQPTGFRIFDDYVVFLSRGSSNLQTFAERHGIRIDDIDSMVFLFTGMRGIDFRMAFQVRMADELLRYTDMELDEVARRAGFGTAVNLYYTYKREFGIAPGIRRHRIRQSRDVGKFKL